MSLTLIPGRDRGAGGGRLLFEINSSKSEIIRALNFPIENEISDKERF